MRSFLLAVGCLLSLVAGLTAAQRITGDQNCVSACYNLSLAVTQCSDLSDTGVIKCICPNSTESALLNTCHGCIGSLQGTTTFEVTSINTLYQACTNGSATAPSSTSSSTASPIGAANNNNNNNAKPTTGAAHASVDASALTLPLMAVLSAVALWSM